MRGEHTTNRTGGKTTWGSSPHARGAHRRGHGQQLHLGIIPACAGSTQARPAWRRPRGDHPRMRGEHIAGDVYAVFIAWIIPACAGSTCRSRSCRGRRGDHPRMRGEHLRPSLAYMPARGSSPHARGALIELVAAPLEVGIIPACAGSTFNGLGDIAESGDHPRMRGEHAF